MNFVANIASQSPGDFQKYYRTIIFYRNNRPILPIVSNNSTYYRFVYFIARTYKNNNRSRLIKERNE